MTETPGRGGSLVLVVEDNERNSRLVRDILEFRGHRTLVATSAEDGISMALEEPPQLVLMDIRLPGMDGMTALQVLRADGRTANVPIVALTASVMPEDRDRFMAAGFDGFIEKPIDVRSFPAQVQALIERGRAAR